MSIHRPTSLFVSYIRSPRLIQYKYLGLLIVCRRKINKNSAIDNKPIISASQISSIVRPIRLKRPMSMFRCFQAKTPMSDADVNVWRSIAGRQSCESYYRSIVRRRRRLSRHNLRQNNSPSPLPPPLQQTDTGMLWSPLAVTSWTTVTGLSNLWCRPTWRRVLSVWGVRNQIFTPRFFTDSDLRSTNAPITANNKRVLRFFTAATFLLCQRFFLLFKNVHWNSIKKLVLSCL